MALALVLCAGCASIDPRPDFDRARQRIAESTGRNETADPSEPPLAPSEIDALLADGLALDEALRMALLNNRRLRAQFMTIGIARADLAQAGLLSNPTLSLLFLLPSGGGHANVQASLAHSVADLWRLPACERIAGAGLEARVLEVSRFAAELVADTRQAYFEGVVARDAIELARAAAKLAERDLAAVLARVRGGVAGQIEQNLAHGRRLDADFEVRRAERDAAAAKRKLAALLSLANDLADVPLLDPLPAPPSVSLQREAVVECALRARLDLRALDEAVRQARARETFEGKRVVSGAALSLDGERPAGAEPDLLGPGLSLTVPVFDQNRAQIARAAYVRRELELTREALASEIAQSVRAAVDRAVLAASAAASARDALVRHAEDGVTLARRAFELGEVTLLVLLDAERRLLRARELEADARTEAARAWNEVERAAGVPIDRLLQPARDDRAR